MKKPVWRLDWDDGLSVGIPELDAEHRHFISLINALNQAILNRMDIEEIKRRMHLILADAQQHFTHEEQLFKQWHYPDAESHVRMHAEATQAYESIMAQLSDISLESAWISAGLKVKQILIDHLLEEDMKYRDFLRSLSITR